MPHPTDTLVLLPDTTSPHDDIDVQYVPQIPIPVRPFKIHPLDPGVPSLRVKRGYREAHSLLSCGVSFEADPVWLWSMRPNDWDHIFISQSDEARLRRYHPVLASKMELKLRIFSPPIASDDDVSTAHVWWISGSTTFVGAIDAPLSVCQVVWLSSAPRRLPTDASRFKWSKISHFEVGGVTLARATFGVSLEHESLRLPRDLERTLGHVLKHSLRPKPCQPNPSEDHYSTTDRLSVGHLARPIVYPTYMSYTGWGIRRLAEEELRACFELPEYVPWHDGLATAIVPIQVFRSVMDLIISRFVTPRVEPSEKRARTHSTATRVSLPDGVWLPDIGRWLSGSWADVDISTKAVKSDDAEVEFGPWHRRVTLLFPCSDSHLGVIERLMMSKWRSNVIRSLFQFMTTTYGPTWFALLMNVEGTEVSAKRKRGSLGTSIKKQYNMFEGGVWACTINQTFASTFNEVYASSGRIFDRPGGSGRLGPR